MSNTNNQTLWPITTLAIAGMALTAFVLWLTQDTLITLLVLLGTTSLPTTIFILQPRQSGPEFHEITELDDL